MNRRTLALLIGSLALATASLQAGSVTYQITVDTSGIAANTPGFVDFQFNQANTNALSGIASISAFSSTGYTFNDANNALSGGITGDFSNLPVVIPNDASGVNYFARAVTFFGSGFVATVTLSGSAVGGTGTDPSTFFIILEDGSGAALYSDLGVVGEIGSITINTDGTTTTASNTFPDGSVSFGDSAVPEPSTILTGLAALGLLAFRRR